MVRPAKVKVLFVPYQPKVSAQIDPPADNDDESSAISWQKHASREYHRHKKAKKTEWTGPPRKSRYHVNAAQSRPLRPHTDAYHSDNSLRKQSQALDLSLQVGDAGFDQLDPFGVIIRSDIPKYAREMFHHSYSRIWDVFSLGSGKAGGVTSAILLSSMVSSASFYSNVYTATAHLSWLHASKNAVSRQNKLMQIQAKGLALSSIRQEVSNVKGFISDDLLCAMLVMAAYGRGDVWDYSNFESRSIGPRIFTYDAAYYGAVDWETTHVMSLVTLLLTRGGLNTITLPGLKEAAMLADLLCASKDIRAPVLGTICSAEETMSQLPRYSITSADGLAHLPTGFRKLPSVLADHPIMVVIRHIKLTIASYEDYLARKSDAPRPEALKFAAATCTQNLLSTSTDLTISMSPSESEVYGNAPAEVAGDTLDEIVYTIVRLASLAFAYQFLWPMPRASGCHSRFAVMMSDSLEDFGIRDGWRNYPELTLWGAIMGASVAMGPMRSRFLQICRFCLDLLPQDYWDGEKITDVENPKLGPGSKLWEQALGVCRTFLFYEGVESSLGFYLMQVGEEAVMMWDEDDMSSLHFDVDL